MGYTKEYEYIVSSHEKLYSFSLSNKKLYMKFLENGKEIDRNVIAKNIKNFSVNIDNIGMIHIVVLNELGMLIHMKREEDIWTEAIIKRFDPKAYEFKNLKIYLYNQMIHILLLLNNTLIHYLTNKNNFKSYKLITTAENYYKTDIDNRGNIHLLYRPVDNKYTIFYRIFHLEYDRWSFPERVTYRKEDIKDMCILCDTFGFVHVVYFSILCNTIKINYLFKKNKHFRSDNWEEDKGFKNIIGDFSIPNLIQLDDHIKLLWKQNNKFYFIITKIGKLLSETIKSIDVQWDCDLIPITYIGNMYRSYKQVKIPLIYTHLYQKNILIGVDESKKFHDEEELVTKEQSEKSYKEGILEEAITIDDVEHIKHNLLEYVNHIKHHFEKNNILSDVLYDHHKTENFNKNRLIEKEILKLHKEIELLKSREENRVNFFRDMKQEYMNLHKKFEAILIEHSKLKKEIEEKNLVKLLKDFLFFFFKYKKE